MSIADYFNSEELDYLKNDFVKSYNEKNHTDFKIDDVVLDEKAIFKKLSENSSYDYDFYESILPDHNHLCDVEDLGCSIGNAYEFFLEKSKECNATLKSEGSYQEFALKTLSKLNKMESDPYLFEQFKNVFIEDNPEMDLYQCEPAEILENLCVMKIVHQVQDLVSLISDQLYEETRYERDDQKNFFEDYLVINPELLEQKQGKSKHL